MNKMNKCLWLFARETFTLFTNGFSRYRDFLKRCLTHNEELKVKLPILAKYQPNNVKAFLSPTIPTDVCWNFIKRTFSLQCWGSKNLDPHSWSLHRKFRFTFTAGCTATKGGTSQWRRGMKGPRRGIFPCKLSKSWSSSSNRTENPWDERFIDLPVIVMVYYR